MSSGLVALMIASVPLRVAVLQRLGGERLGGLTLTGMCLGFVGVAVLLRPDHRAGETSVASMLLVVGGAVAWATGSFYSRRWPLPSDLFLTVSVQMTIGGVGMLAAAVPLGEWADTNFGAFSLGSLLGFAWLVTGGGLVVYTAYVWLLQNVRISTVALYAYVNPVVAILLGWVVLSEPISATTLLGVVLIVVSVAADAGREAG